MNTSRRDFVCRAASALGAVPLAHLVAGCAAATAYRVAPASGQLRLDLTTIPELGADARAVAVQVDGADTPLFVVRQSATAYHALSSVCTHRGCTVESKGQRFVCPCHGSTYARTGEVLRGPAERPLRRFPATLDSTGRTLVVEYATGDGRT
jgi:Rieske Fe-S protein